MWLCLLQVAAVSGDKMTVDCKSDYMLKLIDLPQQKQQEYCDSPRFAKWTGCKLSDISNVRKNTEKHFFGVTEEESVEIFSDEQSKQRAKILDSIEKCTEKHKDEENICVSGLLVLMKAGDSYIELPVIKLLKLDINNQKDYIFIDGCGRVYKNWEDFLKNNRLPNCTLFYPKNGVYSTGDGEVKVENGISPAGTNRGKIFRNIDTFIKFLVVVATGLGIFASLCFPEAFPFTVGW